MNNEIKNKKVEVNDMELNDKDIINILLKEHMFLSWKKTSREKRRL